jgi:hypothetical protein
MSERSLIEAVKDGDIRAVQRMLEEGADVNQLAGHDTALHWAANRGNTAMARLLVEHGANISAKTSGGSTALDIARSSGHSDFVSFLLTAVQQPRKPPPNPEKWVPVGASSVAFVGHYPELDRRLTQIFNFETRQHVLLSENLSSKAESMAAPTSFDDLPPQAVEKALDEFERLGGKPDRDFALQGQAGLNKPRRLKAGEPGHG